MLFQFKSQIHSQKTKLINQKWRRKKTNPLFLLIFYIREQSSTSSLYSSFIYLDIFDKINWEFIKISVNT